MKQTTKCGKTHTCSVITLSLKERLKLLFKGSLIVEIDNTVESSSGWVDCYYQPNIFFKE